MLNTTTITTTSNVTDMATAGFLLGEFMMHNVAVWVHLAIMIVGLITDPMIIIVLWKQNFGSELSIET